uniref:Peptidase_M13 domain-containing protein n=1 Tax=Syphacia muris TaxID=451379 RepID=A0A0N5ANI1_9BILA
MIIATATCYRKTANKLTRLQLPHSRNEQLGLECDLSTVAHISDIIPTIDWIRFFSAYSVNNATLTSKTFIAICDEEYFERLGRLLMTESMETIANFLFWLHAYGQWTNFDERIQRLTLAFKRRLNGKRKNPNIREICTSDTLHNFDYALSAYFARYFVNHQAIYESQIMVKNIRKTMLKLVDKLNWMQEKEKQMVYKKLNLRSDDNLYWMQMKLNKWQFEKQKILLHKSSHQQTVLDAPLRTFTVNAFYQPQLNVQQIKAAIIQRPFIDAKFPACLNYGSLGFIIGHEMTHAFDEIGKNFNEHGEMKPWWSEETLQRFKSRTKCFVQLFDSFTIPGLNVTNDGTLCKNEAIADHVGLKLAYQTYKDASSSSQQHNLPGLEKYTNDQLFFIATAHTLCGHDTLESLTKRHLNDPHPISSIRINALVSNTPQFTDAFSCTAAKSGNNYICKFW